MEAVTDGAPCLQTHLVDRTTVGNLGEEKGERRRRWRRRVRTEEMVRSYQNANKGDDENTFRKASVCRSFTQPGDSTS